MKIKMNGQPVQHLYIIGNGFDQYHGASSSYWDFREYLLKRNRRIVGTFDLYFGPRSLMNSICQPNMRLWDDFERYLCELNREKIFDLLDVKLPQQYEDDEDFNYADYFVPINEIEDIVRNCTSEMKYHFHRWVNTLHYAKGFRKLMLELDPNAVFLNFNYTLFLETEYKVPQEQILYIHGNRRQKISSLILGHRTDDKANFDKWVHQHKNRRRYRHNLKDKKGRYFANDKLVYLAYFLDDERKGNWRNPIRYYAVDHAKERFEKYYVENFKNSAAIIDQHISFFNSLREVRKITVLGHSLGDVDFLYFKQIVLSLEQPDQVKWNFSYYNEEDKKRIRKFCRSLNISIEKNARLFRLSEYQS